MVPPPRWGFPLWCFETLLPLDLDVSFIFLEDEVVVSAGGTEKSEEVLDA